MTVTIHQVNADGAGPYTCDMDPTGNTLGATGQTALTVTNNVPGANGFSQAKTEDFNMTVTMPTSLNCTGGELPLRTVVVLESIANITVQVLQATSARFAAAIMPLPVLSVRTPCSP